MPNRGGGFLKADPDTDTDPDPEKKQGGRMRNTTFGIIAIAVLIAISAGCSGAKTNCDRACLEKFVDEYIDAMVAHDPGKVPFTEDVRFTENGVRLQLGEGLWSSIVGKGTYRHYVPDVEVQQIGFIGTLREQSRTGGEGDSVAVALRLKIQNNEISEAEQLVVRGENGSQMPPAGASIEKAGAPHPVFNEVIPAADRPSREELIRIANVYFSGIQLNDGNKAYPFSDDCDRFENGMQTTNVPVKPGEQRLDPKTASVYSAAWGCKEQFESGLIHFLTRARDRRFIAVDRERGVVFSFVFFDHAAGKTRTFPTPDGRIVTSGPVIPWTWQIAELFKIDKGKIRKVEAILLQAPYGMNSGWSTYEMGMSDQPQ